VRLSYPATKLEGFQSNEFLEAVSAECIAKCVAEKLQYKPGQKLRYSDINFQLLDEVVRRVTKLRLDLFCEMEIFGPLKMTDTGYNPPSEKRIRVAPTTVKDGKALQGIGEAWVDAGNGYGLFGERHAGNQPEQKKSKGGRQAIRSFHGFGFSRIAGLFARVLRRRMGNFACKIS
jgi:CubicO group peptidase (beta-lactamase class C family)